jgi:hypothetical protein
MLPSVSGKVFNRILLEKLKEAVDRSSVTNRLVLG